MANKKIVDIEYAKALRKRLDSKYATKVELSALKDKVFDVIARTYEEDIATDSYVVPSNFDGHGLIESVPCEVKSIKGNSVAFDQLVQNGNFESSSGWTYADGTTEVSQNIFKATLTSSMNNQSLYRPCNITPNHKYLVFCDFRCSKANELVRIAVGSGNYITSSVSANTWTKISGIITPTTSNDYIYFYTTPASTLSIGDTVEFSNFQLFDLTLMGLDSITSVDEFKAKYPLDYYAYDSGSIKSVSVSKIESWDYNLFDGELEIGGLSSGDGRPFVNASNLRSKNYIKVIAGQTYTLSVSNFTNGTTIYIYGYDKNKTFIGSLGADSLTTPITQKIPSNCNYIKLRILNSSEYSSVPTDPQIAIHNASVNLGYKPYVGKIGTINLPNAPITLNGFVDTDIKDKLEFIEQENGTYNAVLTRKIGVDDLGTLNWTYDGTNGYFYAQNVGIKKPSDNNTSVKMISTLYINGTWNTTAPSSSGVNMFMGVNASTGWLGIRNTSYTDTTAFKTAMSGIPLYYEKATPTTEVIATGLTYEQVAMAFEIGGTIINDNENTDYVQAETVIDFSCKDWSI